MANLRFKGLDGLRGICALIVVIFHCDVALHTGHLLNHGWLCVDVFFALSGFVIALKYENRLTQRGGFTIFFRARARRLIPVQILGTIAVSAVTFLLFGLGLLPTKFTLPALSITALYGLLLIPNDFSPYGQVFSSIGAAFPINPPLWSLLDEWIANVIYARFLYSARLSVLIVLIGIAWLGLFAHALDFQFGWDVGGDNSISLVLGIFRATSEFVAGVVLFRLYAQGQLRRLPSARPELIYALWFLVSSVPMPYPIPIFEFLAATFGSFGAIAMLIRSNRPTPLLFCWLGDVSYPLYASHYAVILLSSMFLNSTRHNMLFAIPMVGAAVALAYGIKLLTSRKQIMLLTSRRGTQPAE